MAVDDKNLNEINNLEFNENDQNQYFAAKEADVTADILLSRAEDWFNRMKINGYLEKLRQMYAAYHGAYYDSLENSHNIVFSGEQGELTNIAVNHIRNIAQNMLTLITSSRPSLQARATNTDYKSLVQTQLANGLLDYYVREKKLENYLKNAVEQALVFGSGYVKMEWNSTSGEVYDINDETGLEIKEGDIEFTNLSPFDVIFDGNRSDENHDWVLCRSFKNKFDIAAKYPELKEKILNLPTKSELESSYFSSYTSDETELIPVYEFYHKRTDALPDGRYLLFLASDVALLDTPMPYRDLPVYRIAPSSYLGTPYGYSPLFDLLPLQDAVNASYSAILSNQTAFAVQNVLVPIGSDITVENIAGGMNFIQTDFSQGEPKALQLTATPREVFDFLSIMERTMETLSGISAVTRGNADSTKLTSGTALALVQSMSLQFMSGLQQSYIQMMEDIGTGLINTLKDFASVPRIAMIVGKSNRTYMKEFTGDDLSSINRVIVDIGNPLSKTTAGKVQMAEQLLQMGAITTPEQYLTVINTGQLDTMTEDTQSELYLVRAENERLINGGKVRAMITDEHMLHINEHKAVLSDPDLRFDEDLAARVTAHIQEHIDMLRNADPDLLAIIKQQPLGPQGGSPIAPQDQQPPPQNSGIDPNIMQDPSIAVQEQVQNIPMPNMPTPPPPFENMPVTAQPVPPQG